MEKLINYIATIIHDWLIQNGYVIPLESINILLIVLFSTGLIPIIYKVGKKIYSILKRYRAKKDLHPLIDKSEVEAATKYFISTKGQNISPANEYEPKSSQAFVTKAKLIPFYLKAIRNKNNSIKHYLILADSGMGKSTFLVNLYSTYTRVIFSRKYKMELIPLAHPEADNLIDNIKDQENKILLLDAFDEDPQAQTNYE